MTLPTNLINIKHLISEESCYQMIRDYRWASGVSCVDCDSEDTILRGKSGRSSHCQRYECKACGKRFDDVSDSVFSGRHQPLSVWVLCLYFMGLNLSNAQIAAELELNKDDTSDMVRALREEISQKKQLKL